MLIMIIFSLSGLKTATSAHPTIARAAFERRYSVFLLGGLDVSDNQLAALIDDHEADLVADLDGCKQRLVLHREDHGHARHIEMLDLTVLDRELAVVRIHLLDQAIGHRQRYRANHGLTLIHIRLSHAR